MFHQNVFLESICSSIELLDSIVMLQAYETWQDNPVLTSLHTTGLPISEIDFPAITICGQGSAPWRSAYQEEYSLNYKQRFADNLGENDVLM